VSLEVYIARVNDKPIVANLVELYIYDLNEIAPKLILFELDQNGKFGYPRFERFWQDEGCKAYLFKFKNKFAGFCLVHSSSFYHQNEQAKVVGEFCILKMYRNLGLGTQAIKYIMSQDPGYWEMRVIDANQRAVHFWNKALQQVTCGNYKIYNKNDHQWVGKVFVGKVK
jgi:predicted acetyltransferase